MKAKYLFPSDYMADPSANVFNNRLYIYPSHDWDAGECFDDDGGHFQMKDYHVLSWDDVENDDATDHGVILDVKDVPWAEKQMWDNDVVEKDGKYYLIFSAKGYDGVFRLGVAVADKPEGPFKPMEQPIRGSFSIDPCAFKDDNGEIYVYFGGLWGGQLQWWNPLYHGFETIPASTATRTDSSTSAQLPITSWNFCQARSARHSQLRRSYERRCTAVCRGSAPRHHSRQERRDYESQ